MSLKASWLSGCGATSETLPGCQVAVVLFWAACRGSVKAVYGLSKTACWQGAYPWCVVAVSGHVLTGLVVCRCLLCGASVVLVCGWVWQ
jgi:hypothetical protein